MTPPNPRRSRIALPDFRGYQRWISTRGAYEQSDRDPSRNYGISGVDLSFQLTAGDRAVAWELLTGHFLPATNDRLRAEKRSFLRPTPGGVAFHSAEPQFEGHRVATDCELIDGGRCFCDVGYLAGDAAYAAWAEGGLDGVFEHLAAVLDDFRPEAPAQPEHPSKEADRG